jgi:RNAse (barnase) inhibitor barstar
MNFEEEFMNEDVVNYYADRAMIDLSNRWTLIRGEIDTPLNVVYMHLKNKYLLLSSQCLDDSEHEVVLSSLDWGLRNKFPIDLVDRSVRNHHFKRLAA